MEECCPQIIHLFSGLDLSVYYNHFLHRYLFLGLADIITMSVETVKETNSSAYHIINGQGYSFLTGPISIETFYNLTIFINIIVTCLEFAHPFTTVKSKKLQYLIQIQALKVKEG